MRNFVLTLNIVLPVFLVMATGLFSRSIGLLDHKTVSQMNNIVFRVFLPASLCRSLMNVSPETLASPWAVVYGFCGVTVLFGIGMLLAPRIEKENPRRSVLVQAFFRSNYAIFGIPVCEALFPNGDGGVAAMMVLATVPAYNALAVVVLEYFRGGKPDMKKMLIGILRNPLIIGCAAGFILMLAPIKLPEFAVSTIARLATACSPLALFVLGASINLSSFRANAVSLSVISVIKLLVAPLALLPFAYLLGFRGAEFAALMIAFGSPCAVGSYTMSAQMGGDADLAGQAVMLTTILSSVSVFMMIFMFKQLGVF